MAILAREQQNNRHRPGSNIGCGDAPGNAKGSNSLKLIALYSIRKKTVAPVHAKSDNLFVWQAHVRQGEKVWNPKQSQSGRDGGIVQDQLRNAADRDGLYG